MPSAGPSQDVAHAAAPRVALSKPPHSVLLSSLPIVALALHRHSIVDTSRQDRKVAVQNNTHQVLSADIERTKKKIRYLYLLI